MRSGCYLMPIPFYQEHKKPGFHLLFLGSGGPRRIPDGYDAEKAKADFIRLCKKLAAVQASMEL